MKYWSELLQKPFDTEKECLQAEKEFKRKKAQEDVTKSAISADKKLMASKIEEADKKLKDANENYKLAKNQAAEILEKSNKEVQEILDVAKESVRQAEKDRLEAVRAFNEKYGAYTTTLTGEQATEEFNKAISKLTNDFNPFRWFNLLF